MVEGGEDKKNSFLSCTEIYGHFSYFVTQSARHAFVAVVVTLVIHCVLYVPCCPALLSARGK